MNSLEMSLGIYLASVDIDENRHDSADASSDQKYNLVGSIDTVTKGGVKVEIYGTEHWPPHFHVKTNDSEINATFNLLTCEHVNGQLPQKYKKAVKDWHQSNKPTLVSEWNKFNPNMQI